MSSRVGHQSWQKQQAIWLLSFGIKASADTVANSHDQIYRINTRIGLPPYRVRRPPRASAIERGASAVRARGSASACMAADRWEAGAAFV